MKYNKSCQHNGNLDRTNPGQDKTWTGQTLYITNSGLLKPLTRKTLDTKNPGQDKLWAHQTLDMKNSGHEKPWTGQTLDTTNSGSRNPALAKPGHISLYIMRQNWIHIGKNG
jgi:hypothetical protein